MKWSYGITTVTARLDDHLPRTIASLERAGFDAPRLFVDGCTRPGLYDYFELPTHCRPKAVGNFGNWKIALEELYHAEPMSDCYALFEDDILAVRNLREYLERSLPADGYFNLFLFPENEQRALGKRGWYCPGGRGGLGAQGLVFRRQEVINLLQSPKLARWPLDPVEGRYRVDGRIYEALKAVGVSETCHYPALLQHCGQTTTIPRFAECRPAESFPGEDFDALELLK